ncbi:MAG: metallophosphoesterase [Eubacteriales bacterium]|nr:metallophosphoesterase [Lachnospiraceae bacterium]MDO5127977.1 metallophosphoesterase [Eubacteriales bacterium]
MLQVIHYLCLFLIILLIAAVIESSREKKKINISEYTVSAACVPDAFIGSRFVVIADLHNARFGKDNSKLLDAVSQCKPDYIMIPGDIVVCKKSHKTQNIQSANLIRKLSDIAPVYYSLGNHEEGLRQGMHGTEGQWDMYLRALFSTHESSIHLLDQEGCYIKRENDSIYVAGLTLDRTYFKRFFKKELSAKQISCLFPKEKCFIALMAHNPDYFPEYAASGASMVLAGHNHGGAIRVPIFGGVISPRFHLFPKYDKGKYVIDNSTMILSAGLGSHSVFLRINNVPEINVILLQKQIK